MSNPVPIADTVSEVLRSIKDAKGAYDRLRLKVIPAECETCSIDSEKQVSCSFSGDPECQHLPMLERRRRMAGMVARCRAAKVPGKYIEELDRIDPCAARQAVRRVLDGNAMSAVLLGTPGSGKTLSACRALAERGGLFIPASSLDVLSVETANTIERLCIESMVVLDDVGRGRSATVLSLDRTEDVLCRRYDAGLPTIITANLTRGEFWGLHAIGGGRVQDRLGEDSVTLCREASRRQPNLQRVETHLPHWTEPKEDEP
jgi:hypothetical protein